MSVTTRSEHLADFDRSEDARRHRHYIAELREIREELRLGEIMRQPTRLARDRVVREIDKLIREAEAI